MSTKKSRLVLKKVAGVPKNRAPERNVQISNCSAFTSLLKTLILRRFHRCWKALEAFRQSESKVASDTDRREDLLTHIDRLELVRCTDLQQTSLLCPACNIQLSLRARNEPLKETCLPQPIASTNSHARRAQSQQPYFKV